MSTLPPVLVVCNSLGLLFVTLNSFALGLRLPVGRLTAQFFAHWKIAVCVLVVNFVIMPLLIIGYVLTVAASIPAQVKIGFCVSALAAGAPFAPLFTRLARGNVPVATTLMVILILVTLVVLPIGLPPTVTAVDPSLKLSAWDVAWPLLAFLVLPLALGCLIRLRWGDIMLPALRPINLISIVALLLHVNLYFYAEWNAFVSAWGTGSYLAAIVAPFVGFGCAYLIVALLHVQDGGTRHAIAITTTVRSISASILVCTLPLGAFPLVSVSQLAFNSWALIVLLVFVLEWRRALTPKAALAETPGGAQQWETTLPQPPGGAATA